VVVTAVAVAATKQRIPVPAGLACCGQKQGAFGLLFSCPRDISTTARIAACFFNKSVAHNGLAGFPAFQVCGDPSVSL